METEVKVAEDKLEALGFTKALDNVKKLRVKKRKMAIAYEHYRFVTQEKIDAFNQKLASAGKQLSFTPVKDYSKVPPSNVLADLETAQNRQCFDEYEIASIKKKPDPILFGRINGCSDRFYVSQWENDVKISDIIADNEG